MSSPIYPGCLRACPFSSEMANAKEKQRDSERDGDQLGFVKRKTAKRLVDGRSAGPDRGCIKVALTVAGETFRVQRSVSWCYGHFYIQ